MSLLGVRSGPAGDRYVGDLSFTRAIGQDAFAEGLRYYRGEGVPRDLARARGAFERAAESNGRAAFIAAQMGERGEGGPLDVARSLAWLAHGAELGDADCQFRLAQHYSSGVPGYLPPHPQQEARLLHAAAEQGHAGAVEVLRRHPPPQGGRTASAADAWKAGAPPPSARAGGTRREADVAGIGVSGSYVGLPARTARSKARRIDAASASLLRSVSCVGLWRSWERA